MDQGYREMSSKKGKKIKIKIFELRLSYL